MRITPCSDPRIFTSADSFLFLQKKIESMHMKTIIALIGAMPLTISVELLKYIYQDWEFAKWIGVAVVVDTLLGIAKHWVHKDASSEDFWVKFSKKIVVYIGLLIMANLLTNYTVGGNVVGTTQWMGTYLCTYMIIREAISVIENANAIYPVIPKSIIKRFKDFNEKGEYIKKNETDQ